MTNSFAFIAHLWELEDMTITNLAKVRYEEELYRVQSRVRLGLMSKNEATLATLKLVQLNDAAIATEKAIRGNK